ncbi:hypothetical protein CPB84DRAFT_1792036 [Gymnopilus junonius]|uniref:Tse2 ADP-ribosyltransferase toxin domain-containing protein n=1 Tax=Gymnopilus junonius TaxID=109634 RepID=A0A9P5THE2_GYMJU|nr:hypothetical protein CPB84DRAFT_1792036 [Gymnopilus junonius]
MATRVLSFSRPLPILSRTFVTASGKPKRPLLGRYSEVPVNLRDYETQVKQKRFSFDLKLKDGMVLPAQGENLWWEVVRNFAVIPQGVRLPPSLTILHEHSDHYSLQCTRPMTLEELNQECTDFINAYSKTMDKEQFDKEYPFDLDF